MTAESVLFALLRAAVCDEVLSEEVVAACTPDVLSEVYSLAHKHDLAHLVSSSLENTALPQCDTLEKLAYAKNQAVYRFLRLDHAYQQICVVLESAAIPFIPLKGSVLRRYYPEQWMRMSSDIDILVREEQLEHAVEVLKSTLRFSAAEKGDHDISLYSPAGVHLELHYDTVQQRYADDRRRAVLAKIWETAEPVKPGSREFAMSGEMFYFYHMAHMAKHFENGGCGIRAVLDTWILDHRIGHDREKRSALLEQGGLLAFAQAMEKVAAFWFSGEMPDPITEQVSEYILRGGLYGNKENRAAFGQAKLGGKWRYLITRRIFMPYEYLKAEYPILKTRKWLTPLCQILRWLRMLRSGRAGVHLAEMISNLTMGDQTRSATADLLRQLELRQ